MLRSKQSGQYSQKINNNIGVPQGCPLSANFFNIYDDHGMKKYNEQVKTTNITINKIKIGNRQVGNNLSDQLAEKIKMFARIRNQK